MNLRWLWLDDIPAGLPLTKKQRKEVVRRARDHRRVNPHYRNAFYRFQRAYVPLASAMILCLLGFQLGWFNPWMPVWMVLWTANNQSINIAFAVGIWIATAYARHRSHAPFVRKALIDMGQPVCLACGYILRAGETRCPECGRTIDERIQRLSKEDLSSAEILQTLRDLGYDVCRNCGRMSLDHVDGDRSRCPDCDVERAPLTN